MNRCLLVIAALLATVFPTSAESVFRVYLDAPIFLSGPTTGGGDNTGGGDGGGDGPPDVGGNTELFIEIAPELPSLVELGSSYAGTLAGQGGTAPYSFSNFGPLPPGLMLSGTDLSGTFTQPGVHNFTIGTNDSAGEDGTRGFSVDVMAPLELNYAPTSVRTRIGVPMSVPAPTVNGARSGYTVEITGGSLPGNAQPGTNGAINVTSNVAESGTATLRAVDGLQRTSQPDSFSWTVLPNIAISNFPASTELELGASYTSATPQATNTEGAYTWSVTGTLPNGLTVNSTTGVISGTVEPNAVDANGLRYTVTDTFGSAQSTPFSFSVQSAIVATIPGDVQNVFASSFFAPEDWSSSSRKRLIVPEGVVVGATSTATAALRTGTGMGGTLTIENHGSIQGKGGTTGAAGGPAFTAQTNVILENYGQIYGGGGGGGKGGTGGQGGNVTNYGTWSAYKKSAVLGNETYCRRTSSGTTYRWDGSGFTPGQIQNGYIYECNPTPYYDSWPNMSYEVRRRTVSVVPQAGTTGGNGGTGMGYGTVSTAGSVAAAATNGAGQGGTGGAGGGWGSVGNKGNNGANGSFSSGSVGSNGAAAGPAITGSNLVSLVNKGGTVAGASI